MSWHIRYQKINIARRYDASVTITSNFASFNPTLRYRFFNIQNPSSNFKSSYLNAGFFYSYSILPESLRFLRGNILAVNSDYNLESNKFENIFFSISSNITRIARLQFTLSNSFITNTSTSQIELIFDLPFTRTSTYATENSLTQSIQGSVGYDNAFSDFSFYSRQQIGRAAASFRLFVDDNNNNNYDFGEIIIKDGDISLGVSVTKFKDKNGIIRVRELIPYEVYSVNIIESSIKNPLLVPEYNNFTFRTEPNTFKIIDIPFYIAGEISGKVFKTIDDFKDPVSGIDVIIENVDGTFKKSIKTFADGSYYYFGLKPGSYIIYLNKEQLNFLNLQPDKKENFIEIENKEYGDIVREIDFGLTKKN